MPNNLNPVSWIGELAGEVFSFVDDLHTSDEEKMEKKAKLAKIFNDKFNAALDYQQELVKQKGDIVEAEAESEHILTSIWRPITMLTFTALVVAHWFGLTSDSISPETAEILFSIIRLGLGGYIVGRSGEKITKMAAKGAENYAKAKNGNSKD